MKARPHLFYSLLTMVALVCAVAADAKIPPREIRATAKEAWLYAFPMMESYNTWYAQAVNKSSPNYIGGFNTFRHYSQPFTPANHDIVSPNNDTPYSWAWLDLRAEPIVISVPAVPKDRYYVLQCIDLFTYNCAYIGSRTTGNEAGNFLMVGPKWKDKIPAGFKKVYHSETEIVGILGRTQLNGTDDVANVKAVQKGFRLTPLSAFEKTTPPPAPPALNFPPYDKAKASSHDFIGYLNFLLPLTAPAHPREAALLKQFEKIGVIPGQPWDASKVPPATLSAIDAGVREAQVRLKAKIDTTSSSNGLFGSREAVGENYLTRAAAAAMGLYGNDLAEEWSGSLVGDGAKMGVIHFEKGQMPPARFFWSLTLYTLPDRFLYANPLNRYSIGDGTKGLKISPDGGLSIYVGHNSPGKSRESNWLPSPAGPYSLIARIYGPNRAAIEGTWSLPSLNPPKASH